MLWLKVGRSNNNPKIIGSYFLDFLKESGTVPRKIRMDAGSYCLIINHTDVCGILGIKIDMIRYAFLLVLEFTSNMAGMTYQYNTMSTLSFHLLVMHTNSIGILEIQ